MRFTALIAEWSPMGLPWTYKHENRVPFGGSIESHVEFTMVHSTGVFPISQSSGIRMKGGSGH